MRGIERQQARLIGLDAGPEKLQIRARENHADVDHLATLDARHDADDRVVVGEFSGHARPPRRNARRLQASEQVAGVSVPEDRRGTAAGVGFEPCVGYGGKNPRR